MIIVACACLAGSAQAASCGTSSTYSQLVAGTSGLAAYWRLGDGSGTTACDTAGTSNGTYRYGGNYTLGLPGALADDPDTATRFDGVGGYVLVPDAAPLDPTSALTLEAWVNPASVSGSQTVIRKDGQYLLRLNQQTIDVYLWKPGGAVSEVTSSNVLVEGVWQHVAVTYDGSTVQLYYDGAVVKSQTVSGSIASTTNPLHLGASSGYDYFGGTLDEPAVYGAALTPTQVAAHYSAGSRGAPADLVASSNIGQVTLSWGASGGTGVSGYNVYRQNADGTWPATPYASVGAGKQSYTDTGVTNNTGYTYRVTTWYTSGAESLPSNPTSIMAASPCGSLSSYSTLIASTPGLTGYWRLGEQSGTVACDIAGTSNGTYKYQGDFTLGAPGAISGDPDAATAFDGIAGYVQIPDALALDPSSGLTLEAWVNPTSVTGSQTLIRKDGQFRLRISYQRLDAFLYWADGTNTELMAPASVGAGKYQYVALTYDGSTIRLYDNGALLASAPATGTLATTSNPLLLAASTGYDYLAGSLDEVAAYGAALNASQIAAHYSAGSPAPSNAVPTPPTDLVRAAFDGKVVLRWAASTDDDLAGYRIYRQNADGSWPTTPLASTDANTSQFIDSAVSNGTTYTYRVTAYDGGRQESGASSEVVATPNPPYTNTGGDPVLLSAGDIAGCDTSAQGDALTAAILDKQPGIVVPNGDTVYDHGSADEFAYCYDPSWGRFYSRSMPAPGDHEYLTPNASGYYNYFSALGGTADQPYYSYNLGTWHIVALNSDCAAVGGCNTSSPQEQWLAADLAANQGKCTLAYWHDPRFSSDSVHGNQADVQPFWQDLYNAGAALVLNGSAHDYERFAPQAPSGQLDNSNGIREFVVGTGGRGNYTFGTIDPNSQVRNNTTFGILKLTLHSSSYDWQFLPVAGQTFTDSGTTACHAATTPPTVSLTSPAAGAAVSRAVTLAANASAPGGVAHVDFLVNGQVVGTSSTTPYSFNWDSTSVPDGTVTITARSVDTSGNIASDSHSVTVDNTAPSSSAIAPATSNSSSLTVSFTASDNQGGSGLARVDLYVKAPGQSSYSTVASDTSGSTSGSFSYTASSGDGNYAFYTIAVDKAGSTETAPASPEGTTMLDTVAPSAFQMSAPGQYLRATVTLSSSSAPTDSGSGMASVTYQYRPSGSTNWATACMATASPWSCGWKTAQSATADGQYDLQAVANDRAGNTMIASNTPLTGRTIDNTAPSAKSISTTNVSGGTKGKIEKGDSVTFTYSEATSPGSILAGWTGASTAVQVTITHKPAGDRLTVWKSGGSAQLPLANPLALGGNYVPVLGAAFNATMVQNGASITVTLGALVSGAVNQAAVSGGTLTWTPSASASDLAGNKCSRTSVSASGPAF